MGEVLNVHAQFFRRVFPFLFNPLESFVKDNNIEVLEEFPVGNVAISKDLCTAAHFDRDFSWAFALWYRGKLPTFKKRKGEMMDVTEGVAGSTMGGHFVVPTLRSAFALNNQQTAITVHGSRHCHLTSHIATNGGQVLYFHFCHELTLV